MNQKALVLLSGGLDSTVALAWALNAQHGNLDVVKVVTFHYGQTHTLRELNAASKVVQHYNLKNHEGLGLNFRHIRPDEVGQLVGPRLNQASARQTVPDQFGLEVSATFVPGRNIIFLAYAGSLCDQEDIGNIVIGVNAVDYSGYPDCRPDFIAYMNDALSHGLRKGIIIRTPLINLSKAEIIRLGYALGAPLALTWSCYAGDDVPCRTCPSCKVREKGFADAGLQDPGL